MSPGADLGGEAGEVLVARKFPEAAGDELAGGSGVPALAGQACLQERAVGAAQGAVAGERRIRLSESGKVSGSSHLHHERHKGTDAVPVSVMCAGPSRWASSTRGSL